MIPGPANFIGQRYALGRRLREEPWGEVWLAQDQLLEARWASKFWSGSAGVGGGPEGLEQEAVLALRLRHPLILGVFPGKTERILYLVQEPFTGESLVAQLTRQHHFGLPEALQFLERVSRPWPGPTRRGWSTVPQSP